MLWSAIRFGRARLPDLIECVRIFVEAGAEPMRFGSQGAASFDFSRRWDIPRSTVQAIEDLTRP